MQLAGMKLQISAKANDYDARVPLRKLVLPAGLYKAAPVAVQTSSSSNETPPAPGIFALRPSDTSVSER